MANFYPIITKWNTNTIADGVTMSTSLGQLESNDNYLLALINEIADTDGVSQFVYGVNNTASTITKGTPVYVSGVVGDAIGIAPANNTTQVKSSVIGLVMENINASASGKILLSGVLDGFDTSTFTASTKIYLGSADGSFTITEPVAPAYRVSIGNIINSASDGKIFVNVSASYADYKVKYDSDDTSPDYLINKITADGTTITKTTIDLSGGNKVGQLSSNGLIKVDVDDNDKSTWSHLSGCLSQGDNITLEIVEESGKRKVKISSTAGQGDGDITGSGTATHLVKFTGEKTIDDSKIIEDANGNIVIGSANIELASNDVIIGTLNHRPAGQSGSIIVGNTNTDEGSNNYTLGKDNNVSGTATDRITLGRGNTNIGSNDVTVGINNFVNSDAGNKVVFGKNINVSDESTADIHIGGSKTQLHGTFVDKNGTESAANKLLGFDTDGQAIIVDSVATIWQRTNNGTDDVIAPIDGNDVLNVQTIDFNVGGAYPIPQANEGRVAFEPTEKTLMMNPTDDDRIELGRSLYVRAINNSGSTITKHSVVYLENNSDRFPTIKLADVSTLSKCHNIGVVKHDVNNGEQVEVQTYGVMQGFDTSDFEVTDFIYVSSTGTLTKTAPESPYIPMIVFTVLKKDAMDGWIYINPRIGFNSDSDIAYAFNATGKVAGFDTITNYGIYNLYETNLVNVGESFSSETGKFTIAKTGIYHFHASALINQAGTETSSTCNMWIKRYNSSDVEQESVMAFATTPATVDNHPAFSTSINAIMNCNEGDYVGIVFYISGTGASLYVNKVSFGGFTLTGLKGDQGPIGLTGPSGVTVISEADDVSITDIATDDILAWNGTDWANTSNPKLDSIKLDTTAGITAVEGELTWNSDDKTLDVGLGNSILQVGQEFLVRAVNKTGAPITNGQAVYISGSQGQRVVVSLAQAIATESNQVSLAVATDTVANNATGFFTSKGLVRGINTNSFLEGDILYVSTTAGQLTKTPPAKPYSHLIIGIVTNAGVNGSIYVDPYPVPRISQLTDVKLTTPTSGQVLSYNATTGLWYNADAGGSGADTYQFKLNEEDTAAGFFADKVDVADGSPLTISYTGGKAIFDVIEEDVSDPLLKTVSLLVENGINGYTGSCWSSTFADGEWETGYSQNTTDSYYRLIPDARGTVSKATVYVNLINGEDSYYGGYAGALRIGLFDSAGVLKGQTAWTRGITSVGTLTLDMVAESGQNLTLERNTTYWIGIIGRGLTLISHNKADSGLNLTTLRYSVRIRSASSNASWSNFLDTGTGFIENKVSVVQLSAT